MPLEISTPAIIFPAVTLLILAYTNKFLALASIIRQLTKRFDIDKNHDRELTLKQIRNLRFRINLIKASQACGLLCLISCLISIICLFSDFLWAGNFFFLSSICIMLLSLLFGFCETLISGNALKIELKKIEHNTLRDKQEKKIERKKRKVKEKL